MVSILLQDKEYNHVIISYRSETVPNVGDLIYMLHHGAYKVINIVHTVTDESCYDNELNWVQIAVEKVEDPSGVKYHSIQPRSYEDGYKEGYKEGYSECARKASEVI